MNKERLEVIALLLSMCILIGLLIMLLKTTSFNGKKIETYKEYKRISCTYHCSRLKGAYSFRRCMYDCRDFSDKRLAVK